MQDNYRSKRYARHLTTLLLIICKTMKTQSTLICWYGQNKGEHFIFLFVNKKNSTINVTSENALNIVDKYFVDSYAALSLSL